MTNQEKIDRIYKFMGKGWEHPQPHGALPWGDFTNSWDWLICLISKVEWTCISENHTSYFDKGSYCIWHTGNLHICMDKLEGVLNELIEFINWYEAQITEYEVSVSRNAACNKQFRVKASSSGDAQIKAVEEINKIDWSLENQDITSTVEIERL